MRTRTALLAAAPLLALGLSACGSDDTTSDAAVPAGVEEQYATLADEVGEKGSSVESGEWTVNLVTEAAEPWFEGEHLAHGMTKFREPAAGETNHIEIIPVETSTGRIIPDVPITVSVVDAAGKVVEKQQLDFFYSTFFHYANNFSVPNAGDYTLRVDLGTPSFNRHGEPGATPALAEGATVEFDDVHLGDE